MEPAESSQDDYGARSRDDIPHVLASREMLRASLQGLTPARVLEQLRVLLDHGWGEVRIVVADHTILKVHVTTTHKP